MEILIPEYKLQRDIADLAVELSKHSSSSVISPVLLGVLNGAFMFISDLARNMECDVYVDFVQVESYIGQLRCLPILTKKPKLNLNNKIVYIVEDLVETGTTVKFLKNYVEDNYSNTSVYVVSMIKRTSDTSGLIDFYASELETDDWIYGMGLDDNELKRNYRNIYKY